MQNGQIDQARIKVLMDLGGAEFVQEILRLFSTEGEKQIAALVQAAAQSDREAVNRNAHVLKSSCANLGADTLRDLAAKIEQLTYKAFDDEVRRLVADVQANFKLANAEANDLQAALVDRSA